MRLRSKKLALVKDVMRTIRNLCKVVFNAGSDAQMENIFGISNKEMEAAIKKIVDALPDKLFEGNRPKLEDLKTICAREYIFFQVQEKDDKDYKEDLDNFIKIFSRDIETRI